MKKFVFIAFFAVCFVGFASTNFKEESPIVSELQFENVAQVFYELSTETSSDVLFGCR